MRKYCFQKWVSRSKLPPQNRNTLSRRRIRVFTMDNFPANQISPARMSPAFQRTRIYSPFRKEKALRSHSVRAGSHGMPLGAVPCERARMECPSEPFRPSGLARNAPRSRPRERARMECPSEPFRASGLAWNALRSRSVRAGSHGMLLGAVPCERARMECPSWPFRASGLAWNVTLESKVNILRCRVLPGWGNLICPKICSVGIPDPPPGKCAPILWRKLRAKDPFLKTVFMCGAPKKKLG